MFKQLSARSLRIYNPAFDDTFIINVFEIVRSIRKRTRTAVESCKIAAVCTLINHPHTYLIAPVMISRGAARLMIAASR